MYGWDRTGGSTRISEGFRASGHAMRRLERNWELTLPGIVADPPRRTPPTRMGGEPPPPRDSARAPSVWNASSRGPTGRFRRLASPVRVVVPSRREATPARSRSVVPEFLASIGFAGAWRGPPDTRKSSSLVAMSTPNAAMPDAVASVSSDRSGWRIRHGPPDSAAMTIARWVTLFDGGARIVPETVEGIARYLTPRPPATRSCSARPREFLNPRRPWRGGPRRHGPVSPRR